MGDVTTDPAAGDVGTGIAPPSSSDVDSVAPAFSAVPSSCSSCSVNKGHLRRSRAGMRVRLHGGTKARGGVREEEGSADDGGDDVVDDDDVHEVDMSVASADEVREDAMRAAEEAVDGSRTVFVALSPGFSEYRCESGKAAARLAPVGRNEVFTVI